MFDARHEFRIALTVTMLAALGAIYVGCKPDKKPPIQELGPTLNAMAESTHRIGADLPKQSDTVEKEVGAINEKLPKKERANVQKNTNLLLQVATILRVYGEE